MEKKKWGEELITVTFTGVILWMMQTWLWKFSWRVPKMITKRTQRLRWHQEKHRKHSAAPALAVSLITTCHPVLCQSLAALGIYPYETRREIRNCCWSSGSEQGCSLLSLWQEMGCRAEGWGEGSPFVFVLTSETDVVYDWTHKLLQLKWEWPKGCRRSGLKQA